MQTLTEEFNTATVKNGEIFAVELASNPSTGYRWFLGGDLCMVNFVSENYVSNAPAGSMSVGSDGKTTFILKAVGEGTTEINARYRPSVGTTAKVKNFTLTVQ